MNREFAEVSAEPLQIFTSDLLIRKDEHAIIRVRLLQGCNGVIIER
jgi:hypothetical protein